MTRADQTAITVRIGIDEPVIGVVHSLQSKNGGPLDAKCSGLRTSRFRLRYTGGARS